jgi:hypothetical protein
VALVAPSCEWADTRTGDAIGESWESMTAISGVFGVQREFLDEVLPTS